MTGPGSIDEPTEPAHAPPVASPTSGELVVSSRPLPPEALAEAVLGVVAIAIETLRTGMVGRRPGPSVPVDAALEVTWQVCSRSIRTMELVARASAPVGHLLVNPPMVPTAIRPATLVSDASTAWRQRLPQAVAATSQIRDAVVPSVVDQVVTSINLTELVLRRVDLGRIVTSALDQLDLTDIVIERVDLNRVANAVLDQIDLDQIARDRMDLMGLAEYVVDGIDLPEIIRESTGSVASETVRSVRLQSVNADDAVQRLVDRVLVWRKGRSVEAPTGSQPVDDGTGDTESSAPGESDGQP
ncbi:MAG TPA: hypothetical protein VMT88_11950 [Actinomycetes bacterium]|nr:hypothetical protein [Actinomycetes bacterium]